MVLKELGMQKDLFKVPEADFKTTKLWDQIIMIANWIMSAGLVAGALLSAVFGYYFFSAAFAAAVFVATAVPGFNNVFNGIPLVLQILGVPADIAGMIGLAYNIVVVISLLIWLSGKGD
jgi:hypothetical protein